MKDTREIVLFFKEETDFNLLDVSQELVERYPELEDPIILPDNGQTKSPVILFNRNPELQVQISRVSVNVLVSHNYFDKIASITFDMVDAFEEYECEFYRLGYICSIFLAPQYVNKAKDHYLNMENVSEIQEYNLSWYKTIENKFGKLNCWERFITGSKDFKDLLIQYDFNTPINEDVNLEMKFIKEFVNTANNYIESRINF